MALGNHRVLLGEVGLLGSPVFGGCSGGPGSRFVRRAPVPTGSLRRLMAGPEVVAPAVAGLRQAFASATVAPPAVAADAKLAAQVFQRAGTAGGGFADVTVGYSLANTNVHDYPAE
jgi:hypothetical protein